MGLLRLFLALSVVVHHVPHHSFSWLNAGVAVIVFFMISGFYMALVINEKYSSLDEWRVRFYLSRLGRIFPTYFVVLFFGVLWMRFTSSPTVFTSNMELGFWRQLSLAFTNIFIIGQDFFQTVLMTDAYGKHNPLTDAAISLVGRDFFNNQFIIIGQAWSLAEELVFYAIAPFVVFSVRRIVVLLFVSLVVRVFFLWQDTSFPPIVWGYWFFPSTLSFFCLGSLSYFGYQTMSSFSERRQELLANIAGLAIGLIFLMWIAVTIRGGKGILYEGNHYDSINHWIFYVCVTVAIPFVFLATKNWRFDRLLGELSYPLYLVHGFVIGIVLSSGALKSPGNLWTEIIIIGCSVGTASLIYMFIEEPIDRFRRHVETVTLRPLLRKSYVLLSCGLIVLVLLGTRLQFLEQMPLPPIQLRVVGHYNIVQYKKLFFAIPHGQSVDWRRDNVPKLPGVLVADSLEDVVARLGDVQ